MSARRTWVIADDLTGAADSGIAFSGLKTPIYLELSSATTTSSPSGRSIVVVDTDTRDSGPQVARRVLVDLSRRISSDDTVFKKVDSIGRGEIAAELSAMREVLGDRLFIVCPAVPTHGRTVRDGAVEFDLPDGDRRSIPFFPHLGDFRVVWGDLDVVRASGPDITALVVRAQAAAADVVAFDAQTTGDLSRIVEGVSGVPELRVVWVGAAGLAMAVAQHLSQGSPDGDRRVEMTGPIIRTALVIVGTYSIPGRRQGRHLTAAGVTSIVLDVKDLLSANEGELAALSERIAASVVGSTTMIALDGDVNNIRSPDIARSLARVCLRGVLVADVAIISGGATARAVLVEAGVDQLLLRREMVPGAVESEADLGNKTLRVITKSGSFGTDEALQDLLVLTISQEGQP